MTYATKPDTWHRRHEANAKTPSLPTDDYDFDQALAELCTAVAAIGPDHAGAVRSVLRVLRHRQGLAARVLTQREPTCLNCGGGKKCLGCDDTRPTAEKLAPGWRIVSPLDREETVERVEQATEYAPVRVWTDKTGSDYSWLIPRWRKLDAAAPPRHGRHGTPEIRIIEHRFGRDAPMYAVPTLDTVYRPDNFEDYLAEAHYSRETGWTVTHRPDGGGERVAVDCGRSKAKARTALRQAARQHAKALGVKVTEQPKDGDR